ncbi:MAG: NADH-quinone oxidoreductase subunit NuoE [Chloroflexi bacterium]|nr:NADH-quinone oxidoreductase subunit NuoE [Chloroflexota bacterium]
MPDSVAAIVDKYNREQGYIVSILQDIQEEQHYLPRAALQEVSKLLAVPMSQVYAVASFYKTLSLVPRGKHVIQVCTGTACHVRGAARIVDKLERDLNVQRGRTTFDKRFTLEEVRCVGACAMGPVVVVDKDTHGNVNLDNVDNVIKKYD